MENTDSFGPILRRIIQRKGFKTYEAAAEFIDISVTFLHQLMRSERMPSLEMLLKLSDKLEVGLDELVGRPSDQTLETKEALLGTAVALLSTFDELKLRRAISVLKALPGLDASAFPADVAGRFITSKKNLKG